MIMTKVVFQYTAESWFFNPPGMGGSTDMEEEISLHDILWRVSYIEFLTPWLTPTQTLKWKIM